MARLVQLLLAGVVATAFLGLTTSVPSHAAEPGYWQLTGTDKQVVPSTHVCYPIQQAMSDGSVTETTSLPCLKPTGTFAWSGTWTKPPARLVPGDKLEMTLSARISANEPRLFLGGGVWAALDVAGVRKGGVTGGALRFDEVSVSSADPQRQAQTKSSSITVPAYGFGDSQRSNTMQLRVDAKTAAWYYIYTWTVPAEPTPAPSVPLDQAVSDAVTAFVYQFDSSCFSKVVSLGNPDLYRAALEGVSISVDPALSANAVYNPGGPSITLSFDPRSEGADLNRQQTIWHEATHRIEDMNWDTLDPRSLDAEFGERNVEYMQDEVVALNLLQRIEARAQAGAPVEELRRDWDTFMDFHRQAFDMRSYGPDLGALETWTGFQVNSDDLESFYRLGGCGDAMRQIFTDAPSVDLEVPTEGIEEGTPALP